MARTKVYPLDDDDARKFLEMLGATVKEKRMEKNLSMREFSKLTGCNRRTLTLFERGERSIDVLSFVRICKMLGVNQIAIIPAPIVRHIV